MQRIMMDYMQKQILLRNGWTIKDNQANYQIPSKPRFNIIISFEGGQFKVWLTEFGQMLGEIRKWDKFFDAFAHAGSLHFMLTGKLIGGENM